MCTRTHTLTDAHTHTHTTHTLFCGDRRSVWISVRASCESRKWPTCCCLLFLSPSLIFWSVCLCVCFCQCMCACVHVRVCVRCVCSHRPIPGLKLVPARSPNGSIDHCSVPFSNQRTAVVASSTQEITHFNEETVIIFSLQRGREGGETMRETRM